jgi:hypothetical protein
MAQAKSAVREEETELEEIIVTANRLAAVARLEQKEAANLINVQSAEDIAKYPDFDAAQALGRIPGLTMAGDTGEGRFISIRGMDGNFNGSTFGGVTLLNTNPQGTYFTGSGRAVEFDTIPVGAIDRILVTKTGLPDHDAEGLGGSVELTPRSAAKLIRPFLVEGTVGGGYESEYPNFAPFRAEGAIGGRFGDGWGFSETGPLSFVLSASESDDERRFDDLEASYLDDPAYPNKAVDNYQLRHYNYHRKRFGLSGDLEYHPTIVDSGAHTRLGENNILPGTSRYTGNAGLFYDAKKMDVQLSAQYTGKSLFTAGSIAGVDVYEDTRTTLDFTSRYFVIPNASVYFNAKNLTNSPLRFYEGSANRPIQREYYDYARGGNRRLILRALICRKLSTRGTTCLCESPGC